MDSVYKKQFRIIKKHLGIKNIISIRFSNTKSGNYRKYQDTASTILARSFKNNVLTYIDRKEGQLCPGGNYFLDVTHPPEKEICDVYVKDEGVFKNNAACHTFLRELPKYPAVARKRYILFTPLTKEINNPDVIIFLATPAQTSRILGLSVYEKMSYPLVIPAGPTSASIYAPIGSDRIHINFIDYYDRYYQGARDGQLLWKDSDLIISMPFGIFQEIIKRIPLSAHGIYKPTIKPQKVDPLSIRRRAGE